MILRIARAVVKRAIELLGYRLSPLKNNPGDYLDINRALALNIGQNSPYILDVGANVGQSVDWLLSLFPAARIYCFEPHEGAFEKLTEKYGSLPNVQCWRLAIGDWRRGWRLRTD